MKYLSDKEILNFFSAVKKGKNPRRDLCLFGLMLSYGMRLNEVLSIRLEDLSLDPLDPQIFVRRLKRRKPYGRWHELSKENFQRIKSWLKERKNWRGARSEYLFLSQKSRGRYDHLGRDCLWNLVKRYGKAAGIEDIYPHKFRYTAGVRMAREGLNAFTIQRRLGHADVKSTQGYVDLFGPESREEDRKCAEAIEF